MSMAIIFLNWYYPSMMHVSYMVRPSRIIVWYARIKDKIKLKFILKILMILITK